MFGNVYSLAECTPPKSFLLGCRAAIINITILSHGIEITKTINLMSSDFVYAMAPLRDQMGLSIYYLKEKESTVIRNVRLFEF